MVPIDQIQAQLQAFGVDAWLFYDCCGQNPLAVQAVAPENKMLTRRWFCLVPAHGAPQWLIHRIEVEAFSEVPGTRSLYAHRLELEEQLRSLLEPYPQVAMEYSPAANVPSASRVDGGTLELVRACGAEVVSSADLIQSVLAPWPLGGLEAHKRAAAVLEQAVRGAWEVVAQRLKVGNPIRECELQRWLKDRVEKAGLAIADPPIVAVDEHGADPHFAPSEDDDRPIAANCVLMIDIWAREPGDSGVYADVTFMAYTGLQPPQRVVQVFNTVAAARDAALALVEERGAAGKPVRGFECDRAARAVIEAAGFGAAFTHRTGHSLGPGDHWLGANLDDFETHDDRLLIPGTGFTIEPGIYLPGEFGVRSEIDLYWGEDGPEVTTWRQDELELITPPG